MKTPLPILLSALLFSLAPAAENNDNLLLLDQVAVENLQLETVAVTEDTFNQTVLAIGHVAEIPNQRAILSTRIPGRIVELNVIEGDHVEQGQILGKLESLQPGNPPPTIDLIAPQSGLVVQSSIVLGQPVQASTELMAITNRERVWVTANIPEQRAASIGIGSKALISFPALDIDPIQSELIRFATEADHDAGAIRGIFEIHNPDQQLRPNMRAECAIIINQRDFVLSVPQQAIQGDPTKRVVYAEDFEIPNAYRRLPVVTGETSAGRVEIKRGLFPGDQVVTQGSYMLGFVNKADGASLKEALDAAHGHEHAEDGSELSQEELERRAAEKAAETNANNPRAAPPKWPLYLAATTTLTTLLFLQLWLNQRKKTNPSKSPPNETNPR